MVEMLALELQDPGPGWLCSPGELLHFFLSTEKKEITKASESWDCGEE